MVAPESHQGLEVAAVAGLSCGDDERDGAPQAVDTQADLARKTAAALRRKLRLRRGHSGLDRSPRRNPREANVVGSHVLAAPSRTGVGSVQLR